MHFCTFRKGSRVLPNTSNVSSRRNSSTQSASYLSRNRSGLSSREHSLTHNPSSRENSFSKDQSYEKRNSSRISFRDTSRNSSKLSAGSRDRSLYRSWRSNRSRDGSYIRERSQSRERSLSRERGRRQAPREGVRSRSPSPIGRGKVEEQCFTSLL